MQQDKVICIELFGERHKFETGLEESRAQMIASRVQIEISKAQSQVGHAESENRKIVVLLAAALNIVNDICELQRNHSEFRSRVGRRTGDLIRLFEDSVEAK